MFVGIPGGRGEGVVESRERASSTKTAELEESKPTEEWVTLI